MNILLCVDEDAILDDLLVAFRWSVRVGPADRVLVLHVLPKLPWLRTIGRVDPTVGKQIAEIPKQADEVLSRATDFLIKEGVQASPVRRDGDPAAEILQAAREEDAGLIVLGALGREDKENFLLGSVSQKIKRHADRDVFIVRRHAPSAGERFQAIAAVDGSDESVAAVRSFAGKMQSVLADVHLLHVSEHLTPGRDDAIETAREILEQEGLACTSEVRHGRPASEILACARERDAHVIVVGARGLGALSSAFMGSVSARVLRHAPCAVFCGRSME